MSRESKATKEEIQRNRDEAYQNGWGDGYAEGFAKATEAALAAIPATDAREKVHDDIRAAAQLIIDRVLQEPTHEAARLRELMVNATLTIRHTSLPRYRRWMMVNEAIRTLAASLIDETRHEHP